MLKSEIKKLENLSPEDTAKDFRKRITYLNIFEKKLNKSQQKIIFRLVYNLLEENYRTDSGYFFKKLLEENKISYSKLAEHIYVFLCYQNDYNSDEFSIEKIKSQLEKMTKSKTFTKSPISDLICAYFSVDENLIKYGFGYRYKMNHEKAFEIFKDENPEEIIKEILDPNSISNKPQPTEKEKIVYQNFIKSDVLFADLLKLYCKQDINFISQEKDCLWDCDYLAIMINKLNLKEQHAVFDLIEQLQKL